MNDVNQPRSGPAANTARGEVPLIISGTSYVLRPSFTALVEAEEEIGPLFAMVERAGEGQLRLAEIVALFWHCLPNQAGLTREDVGNAVIQRGLAGSAPTLRCLLQQILQGQM